MDNYTMHASFTSPFPADRASRVVHVDAHPETIRLWRKWMSEQGQPSAPNRAQRRELQRFVQRRRREQTTP